MESKKKRKQKNSEFGFETNSEIMSDSPRSKTLSTAQAACRQPNPNSDKLYSL